MESKSIIYSLKKCYLCGEEYALEKHHCLFGSANRKKAEADKLYVFLCHKCHTLVHNEDTASKLRLQQVAQQRFEENIGTRDDFIKRYGKSYLS